jgi:hypothetical protein
MQNTWAYYRRTKLAPITLFQILRSMHSNDDKYKMVVTHLLDVGLLSGERPFWLDLYLYYVGLGQQAAAATQLNSSAGLGCGTAPPVCTQCSTGRHIVVPLDGHYRQSQRLAMSEAAV